MPDTQRLIVNIRGANGSGKTTLARGFLAHKVADVTPWAYESQNRPRSWPVACCKVPKLRMPVYVLGSYVQVTGGCDREKDMDAVEALARRAASELLDGHVLFEGFIVSKSGVRWIHFAQSTEKEQLGKFVWVFTRPSVEEMERRIKSRNGGKPINLEALKNSARTVDLGRIKIKQAFERQQIIDLDTARSAPESFDELVSRLEVLEQQSA